MGTRLDIRSVEIRGGPTVLASDEEVNEAEARLGSTFPDGYREYVTQLGEGALNAFVRVLPPWRILAEVDDHRGMMSAFWLWEDGKADFRQEQAMDSIPLADTLDGDVLTFHPDRPDQVVVLPRHSNRVYLRGPDLLETINWVCSGGVIRRFGPTRYFEPFDSRTQGRAAVTAVRRAVHLVSAPRRPGLSPRDVLLAYFAELRDVEEWALRKAGGPDAILGEGPSPWGDSIDELMARTEAVHARYCTPRLASALRGASVTVSTTPEHDPGAFTLLEEKQARSGRVEIRTAEGTDLVWLRKYLLEPHDGEWWISSRSDLGLQDR